MWFCPCDGTLLQVRRKDPSSQQQMWYCTTCPYSCTMHQSHTSTIYPIRKTVDDILGGAQAWDNVDRTSTTCPICNHKEAYFLQMQIRSADEPMSIFYKCCNCSHQWNDK